MNHKEIESHDSFQLIWIQNNMTWLAHCSIPHCWYYVRIIITLKEPPSTLYLCARILSYFIKFHGQAAGLMLMKLNGSRLLG